MTTEEANEKFGFLLNAYKKDDIIIYPEPLTFKIVKILPTNAIKSLFDKIIQRIGR